MAVRQVAGNALAGYFRGIFPTQAGKRGKPASGSFRVRFAVIGSRATQPKPLSAHFFKPRRGRNVAISLPRPPVWAHFDPPGTFTPLQD